ncbi:hypothetical protein Tco_1460874 [Tanacetum coccineum]
MGWVVADFKKKEGRESLLAIQVLYKIIVRVIDDIGSTSLVLFDNMVHKLLDEVPCWKLMEQYQGAGKDDEEDVEVTTKGKAVSKVNSTETEQDGDTSFVTPETVKWTGRTSSKMGYYDDLKFMINEEYNGKESSRRGKQCD